MRPACTQWPSRCGHEVGVHKLRAPCARRWLIAWHCLCCRALPQVQLDIRQGHAQTVEKVLRWVDEEGDVEGTTICDSGCGTGSLAIPLALRGATVSASDISAAMAGEAARRYEATIAAGAKPPAVSVARGEEMLEEVGWHGE